MASSLELNKLLAGVLTAGVIAVGAGVFASILYRPHPLEEHAFSVVVPEGAETTADAAETTDEPSIAVLLASADPSAGETITRQCAACHVFNEGGENRVGPALWGVVGRDIASHAGFSYSNALSGLDGEWTYEQLNGFLAAPRDWAPGTSMSYAGLRDAGDRANLIAYLRSLSNDPMPLPEPVAAAEEAAPTEETVAAAEESAPADGNVVAAEEAASIEEPVAAAEEAAPADEPVVAAEEAAPTVETVTPEEAAPADATVAAVEEAAPTEETVAAAEEPAAVDETAAAEEPAPAAETAAAAGGEPSPMVAMVAAAAPADGEAKFRQCAACHTVDQGGQNRVGPNLWGVFGADIGTHEGFNYSEALTSLEGAWTVDKLNAYLENPRGYAPGNRMAFAGLRSEEDRAAVIAYLHSLSEDPKPLDIE